MAERITPDDETRKGLQSCWVSQRLVMGRDRWLLVVCADDSITTCELPNGQEVVVGRAQSNHVCIEHTSISRVHVKLSLRGDVTVADQGSTNGTMLGGKRLEPHVPTPVRAGQVIQLGSVTLVLQRLAKLAPRNVLTHDYFEARLEEECAKRSRRGGAFGVMQLLVDRHVDKDLVEAALHRAVRAQDVIALYAPGEYEVLVDAAEHELSTITDRLLRAFKDDGIEIGIALARYPADGNNAGDLIARAHESLHGVVSTAKAGATSALAGLDELAVKVAASELSVLILGETGVGKEVMAEAIHRLSPRSSNTFLRLNCAALTESLVESELFGHTRGAFTGANTAKAGLLESAQGGTVFLDEIGELSLTMQVKLLRVVEERRVTPVGGLRSRSIDVRFIAATNRDLEEEIVRGRFRQDLFFRLSAVTLVVPPLRERTEEIASLAEKFASLAAKGPTPAMTDEAMQALLRYGWPGNIRELRNVVERAVLLSDGNEIDVRHLPLERMRATRSSLPPEPVSGAAAIIHAPANASDDVDLSKTLPTSLHDDVRALERQRILDALERCAGNQTKAARLLGISRGTLVARITEYEIPRPRKD